MATAQVIDGRGSLDPIAPERFGLDQARRLLWRAGLGGTQRQIQTLASWGPKRAVDHLLDVKSVKYDEPTEETFDGSIMTPLTRQERLQIRKAQREQDEETLAGFRLRRQKRQALDRDQIERMQRWWLTRLIETPKPLEEKMTLFWHGHFATSYRTIENSYHMFMQNQLFRRRAVESFADLAHGMIRDPAMLAYLDNNSSHKEKPNENLARELMELFTLGVGRYTEQDIKEGARALTGYTFFGNDPVFRRRLHDFGPKRLLGREGALDGDDFVSAILSQRACAEFICLKLHRFFVANEVEEPSKMEKSDKAVVRRLASIFRSSRYELRPVLRALFLSEHFYSEAHRGSLIKSPIELVVGLIRSLEAPPRELRILLGAQRLMGQELFFPPSVAGWAGGRSWINTSTLFVRQNVAAYMLTGALPEGVEAAPDRATMDPSPLLDGIPWRNVRLKSDAHRVCVRLLERAIGPPPGGGAWAGSERVDTLMSFVDRRGGRLGASMVVELLTLITAMPEYQLC